MCGLSGFIDFSGNCKLFELNKIISVMTNTLKHRGPDDEGTWSDKDYGIALGHRRLSIIDLSSYGHQPMFSRSGRFVIVYNGEVYNFQEIREELVSLGHNFRSTSDTEVILQSVEQWGIYGAVIRFVGMFAFVLYDKKEGLLHLVRDRLGVKPLYYGWGDKLFIFGSELKTLCAHPNYKKEINRDALALYLRYNNIPCPYTIYKNTNKLAPGSILTINVKNPGIGDKTTVYWTLKDAVEKGIKEPFTGSLEEAGDELEIILRDAVKKRLISDVSLGAFLSGGIDSSTVVALMQAQSTKPVKTFTVGFYERNFNEAKKANLLARYLNTEHTEIYATAKDATNTIPLLPLFYDEPFADSSQIPTYLISKLTREHVTVCLSGDGGDELFAGYNRYLWSKDIWLKTRLMPRRLRLAAANLIKNITPSLQESVYQKIKYILPIRFRFGTPSDKFQKFSAVLNTESWEELYSCLISHCENPNSFVINGKEPVLNIHDKRNIPVFSDFRETMMYMDAINYLPNDILVKVDRASMAVSLETRGPFLDHRVIEFVWKLPFSMKINKGITKFILRKVLHKYVPERLTNGHKSGFSIPLDNWLRGPLRDWAENLINRKRINNEGFFDAEEISKNWHEHCSARSNRKDFLWPVLMFQAWKDHWI